MNSSYQKKLKNNVNSRICLTLMPILLVCGCICPHNIFEQLLIETPTSTTTQPDSMTSIEIPMDNSTATTTTTTTTTQIITTTTTTLQQITTTTTSSTTTTTTTKKTTTTLKNISCYDVRNPSSSNCKGAICPSGGTCEYKPGSSAGCCGMPGACYCN